MRTLGRVSMQFTMRLRHHSLDPKLTVGAICLSELTAPESSRPVLSRGGLMA
jgi:hypothetical protein